MSRPRSRRLPPTLTLAALLALAGGCAKKQLPIVKADPSEVEYAGCFEVLRTGPKCLLGSDPATRKLTLYPRQAARSYEIRVDGVPIAPAISEQRAISVTIPPGGALLDVRAETDGGARSWTLAIADFPSNPKWFDQVLDLVDQGSSLYPQAKQRLDENTQLAMDPALRALSLTLRGQLEQATSGWKEAEPFLRRALAANREAGYLWRETYVATFVAFQLIQAHRFDSARDDLYGVNLPSGAPAEAVQTLTHNKGLLAKRSGDFRTALEEFQAAAELAGRVELTSFQRLAEQEQALLFSKLGRFGEATAIFDRLARTRPKGDGDCARAVLLTNQGWSLYLAREAGDWQAGDPTPPFATAQRIFEGHSGCPQQRRESFNASVNMALAYLQGGRLTEAEQAARAATSSAEAATPLERLWWLDLQARIGLARNRPEGALRLYQQLDRQARTALSAENLWRATYGRARALDRLSRTSMAADALRDAESLVDQQLLGIPLDEGRESFSDQWAAGSRLYVDLLLRLGRTGEAFEVARQARGRVLRQLAAAAQLETLTKEQRKERDDALTQYWELRNEIDQEAAQEWQQPSNQLLPQQRERERRLRGVRAVLDRILRSTGLPNERAQALGPRQARPGELTLTYFPLARPGAWVGFADDGQTIASHQFVMPTGSLATDGAQARLAEHVLAPFQAEILASSRLRILPYGKLRSVDFHALPFAGKALLETKPVVYGLDLPVSAPAPPATRQAVVVADSRGDLQAAQIEGRDVRSVLLEGLPPWNIDLLEGSRATAEALRQAIGKGIDLFHYAGHADFSGRGGWESQIPLANDSRLTLGDMLTLNRAPTWVVLSGCETGLSDETSQVESQGLAHAFLLRGSKAVVAATRRVDDKIARNLVVELYRNLGSVPDFALLLQRAQLELKNRGVAKKEWSSFRVFEP